VRVFIAAIAAVVLGLAQPPAREVAITFDDLPIAGEADVPPYVADNARP
jgi:hypothetical protein